MTNEQIEYFKKIIQKLESKNIDNVILTKGFGKVHMMFVVDLETFSNVNDILMEDM